jgi:hypothetical protein
MISPKELNNLVDQLKIIARLSKVVRDEEIYEKRKYANLIVEDALNHLVNNLEELREQNGQI